MNQGTFGTTLNVAVYHKGEVPVYTNQKNLGNAF